MKIIGQNKLNRRFRFVVNIVLVLLVLTASVKVNADSWNNWSQKEREAYLAGVQDTAEAIAFQMARGVGPKELLHSIVELFMESSADIYNYMQNTIEPTGTGRITRWISQEIVGVLKNKNYKHAGSYLR